MYFGYFDNSLAHTAHNEVILPGKSAIEPF